MVQTHTARIVRRFPLIRDGEASFVVEVRGADGAARRWPQSYASHAEAMTAADRAGIEVLAGWCDEYA